MTSLSRNLNLMAYRREKPVVLGQPALVASVTRIWLTAVCLTLMGYAIMGRGFAYLGVPPVFLGEVLAIAGLACLIFCGRWWVILRMPQTLLLLVLFAWCAARTIPFIGIYKIDALRDAVIWLYGIYAITIAGVVVCQPALVSTLITFYRRFIKIFLLSVPFVWMAFQFLGPLRMNVLPTWPWAENIPIFWPKAGDLQVHLGGILAFWASGVGGFTAILWFIPMFINAAMVGPVNRGGMLAFLTAIMITLFFKPLNRWAWGFILVAVFGLSLLAVTGVSIKVPGSERPISFDQMIENFVSVGSKSEGNLEELQGTKTWRINIWTAIINDTFYGKHFWTGKGFGINLVSDYGFIIDAEETVRAPHNGHMTMLARTGVPGFFIWIAVHLSWALGIFDGYLRATWAGKRKWAGLFMFLLIYWLMVMINSSFDPYIEGPMGGIWLWSIYGFGLAAMYLRAKSPDLLDDEPVTPTPVGMDTLLP